MANRTRQCSNCNGTGKVRRQVKPGEWREETCHGCGGSGLINLGTI